MLCLFPEGSEVDVDVDVWLDKREVLKLEVLRAAVPRCCQFMKATEKRKLQVSASEVVKKLSTIEVLIYRTNKRATAGNCISCSLHLSVHITLACSLASSCGGGLRHRHSSQEPWKQSHEYSGLPLSA